MTKKKLYPGTDLDRKIKKGENVQKKRAENFAQLCQFHHLDSGQFDHNDPSPWRELCTNMMNHLIPGFKMNKSGNKLSNTYASDNQIIAVLEFDDVELLEKTGGKKQSIEEKIARATKIHQCSPGHVKHALQRIKEFHKNYSAELLFDPPDDVILPEYLAVTPADDRKEKNRKRKK